MFSLTKPYGGILINRILSKHEIKKLSKLKLKRINTVDDFILDAEKIAIGAYSPLKGFMCRDDFSEVVNNMRLCNKMPWTIPIFLPIDKKAEKLIFKGDRVIICNKDNIDMALLEVKDIFSYPKDKWARKVYGTESAQHPGVRKIYDMPGKLAGGDIWLINKPDFKFHEYNLDPLQTRQIIKERKWKTVAGFQTRNVPHRAHEYLQKIALTITDGILIHPIIGWKKDGDFKPEVIIKAYKMLIDKYFPNNSVIFTGLATAMRYAGPREAVFHAIIRKNYGCTHFIVGRDHAGVGDFYGLYDAHKIFDQFQDIGITPLLLRGPYYCTKCKEVVSDKICPHSEKWHSHISGTIIRKLLSGNKKVPGYLMRPEVADIISRHGEVFI